MAQALPIELDRRDGLHKRGCMQQQVPVSWDKSPLRLTWLRIEARMGSYNGCVGEIEGLEISAALSGEERGGVRQFAEGRACKKILAQGHCRHHMKSAARGCNREQLTCRRASEASGGG